MNKFHDLNKKSLLWQMRESAVDVKWVLMYACVYACVCVYACICICICACVCVCACACVYAWCGGCTCNPLMMITPVLVAA